MLLLELPFEHAVAACAVRGRFRGHTGGTKSTRRVLKSLGMTLHKVSKAEAGLLHRGSTLKDLQNVLQQGSWPSGRYLVSSKRDDDPVREEIFHASAVVDGQLLDGKGNIRKPLRITAIRRVEGALPRARSKAANDAKTIRLAQQPVAIGKLSCLSKLVGRRQRLASAFGLAFLHPGGRRKRGDTIVEWYPLRLARQPQAAPDSNVRSLAVGFRDILKTDFTTLRPVLIDRHGRPKHGNIRVRRVTKPRPRGRPARVRFKQG